MVDECASWWVETMLTEYTFAGLAERASRLERGPQGEGAGAQSVTRSFVTCRLTRSTVRLAECESRDERETPRLCAEYVARSA